MDPATVSAAATTTVAVGSKIKETLGTISELMDRIHDCRDMNVTSLTAFAKRTLITSRVYVEEQLSTEDVTYKLLKVLNSIYSGFIMCAVGLTNLVVGGRTVREMLNPIATENFIKFNDLIASGFGDPEKKATPALEDNNQQQDNIGALRVDEKKLESASDKLFTGRLLSMNVPTPDGKAFPLYFYVQLLPKVIPEVVMSEFLRANMSPTRSFRWAQWRAGEISFWKDFVFEADRVAKRQKALKADKDGILREVEDHRARMLKKKMANFKTKEAYARQRNLCNSIIICTKRTMDNCCQEIGVNLKNVAQRNEFMDDLFAVMLAVVDTNYGTIDLYMNGIEGRGEYTSKAIDAATKNGKELDMKEIMTLISAGSAPRF